MDIYTINTNLAVVTAIIPEDPEWTVLVKRLYAPPEPCWKFPGGGIKKGESVIDAAIREAFEETGITLFPDEIEIGEDELNLNNTYHANFCIARGISKERMAERKEITCEDDPRKKMKTGIFKILEIPAVPDFLKWHRSFSRKIEGR